MVILCVSVFIFPKNETKIVEKHFGPLQVTFTEKLLKRLYKTERKKLHAMGRGWGGECSHRPIQVGP